MSNNQSGMSAELWKLVTRASTGQMSEASLVARLKELLADPASLDNQAPWGWIAHCAKSGGEPIIVTETVAKELSKFDDWEVFQVVRVPPATPGAPGKEASFVGKILSEQAKVAMGMENQRVVKPCDQPQAHPARCGCVPQGSTANQLLARVVEFDKSARTDQGFNLSKLVSDIQEYLQEQGQ